MQMDWDKIEKVASKQCKVVWAVRATRKIAKLGSQGTPATIDV